MNQEIINRANQLMDDKEYGHELTWEKALRFAREEAEEKAAIQTKQQRKRALWNEYKAALRAAGVAEAAMKVLAPSEPDALLDLPMLIAIGRIRFSDTQKETAVKAAIQKLYFQIGYKEPDFNADSYTKQSYIKWGLK